MNKIYLRLYAGVLNTQNEREMFGQLTQILIKWYITIDHGIISTDQWKDNRIMTCQWSKDWKLRVNQYHHFTKRCTVTPYFNDKDMGVAYDEPKGKIFSKREKKKKKPGEIIQGNRPAVPLSIYLSASCHQCVYGGQLWSNYPTFPKCHVVLPTCCSPPFT